MKNILIGSTLLIVLFTYAVGILAQAIISDYTMYMEEGQCVSKHIALNVERKNISTAGGTCSINY